MFCPYCGANNPENAQTCASCGTPLVRQPQAPQYRPPTAQVRTSPMAIWSLVLAILGCLTCITAIPGLILGILGYKQANDRPQEFSGKGLAAAGIVVSVIALIFGTIGLISALKYFPEAKEQAFSMVSQNNVRELCQAISAYSQDYDGKFPPAATWCDATKKYASNDSIYIDPAALTKRSGYGFNSALGGISESDVASPAETVMIFESDNGWNANGGPEAMIRTPRYDKGFDIGYVDRHVSLVGESDVSKLIWKPTR